MNVVKPNGYSCLYGTPPRQQGSILALSVHFRYTIGKEHAPTSTEDNKQMATIQNRHSYRAVLSDARGIKASKAFEKFGSVKVKVGKRPVADERRMLELLVDKLPTPISLRIDANRRLALDQAIELFGGLPRERIEYLEEPLQTGRALKELTEATGLRLALDESLFFPDPTRFREGPLIAAWILKPARMGGYLETMAYAERAQETGKFCVISSCLESGLGLWAQAQLAAAVNEEPVAAGLATDTLLDGDLIDPPFDSSAGTLRTADWRGEPSEAFLTEAGWMEEARS